MKWKDKIKKAWDEEPMTVIVVASAVVSTAVMALSAVTSARNAQTWRNEVNRRMMMQLQARK